MTQHKLFRTAAPLDPRATTRRTPDDIWPLRGTDGLTFAERKQRAIGAGK